MGTRRKFSPELKAQIVLDILKEEKSIAEIASEHGVHPVQLSRWKTEAIENFPQLFVDNRKGISLSTESLHDAAALFLRYA
jgi:transposase